MLLRWKIAQWFELQWWKRYLTGKSKEEYIAWKTNYWLLLMRTLELERTIEEANTIIDFGCGPFGLPLANQQWKKELTAVDPLLDEYAITIPFFDKHDYSGTHFITQSMEDFSSPEKFDLVFCMNAINHVHSMDKAFDVVVGSTQQNSKIVVSIDAHNFSFFKFLFRLIPGDILHPHQYDLKEYSSFLESRNCKIEQAVCIKQEFFFDHYVLVARKL
ncbi:MAG: class I SAM-dependent methyltransferase [Chitinophagales bacterium]|nr:class I SAM-dependent methyltransferase [Chitinophagales bacterium]